MARIDTYETVTAAIIAQLEAGVKPWSPRWVANSGGFAMPRRVTGESYRGINVLLLWAAAEERGYRAGTWMTFKQAIDLGCAVRKGEKSSKIVFFKKLTVTDRADPTGEAEKQIPMLREYAVFNVEQIDGLPDRFTPTPVVVLPSKARDEVNEAALRSSGADIRESGDQAFYSPGHDFVNMPMFDRFHTAGCYLATLAHEVCNIASVLISRTVDGLLTLVARHHRRACLAMSGRES